MVELVARLRMAPRATPVPAVMPAAVARVVVPATGRSVALVLPPILTAGPAAMVATSVVAGRPGLVVAA
jgi:hypothetical protein